jgi:hypothetical protein
MNPIDELVHITVRIETAGSKGNGSGTGFIMNLCQDDAGCVPVIVTNKHVINGAHIGQFHMTRAKAPDMAEPDLGNNVPIPMANFESLWIKHPNPDVDLAVLPIAPVLLEARQRGITVFYRAIPTFLIADDAELRNLLAIEDVIMIGYPNGLWDEKSNYPIVRRGITATPPGNRFNGRPEFVVDCACFPGSSGSPVLLFNPSSYFDKNGTINLGGGRVKLLGVLWGGPQYNAVGELHVVPVPTANASSKNVALSSIPMNLGYCVRAEELRWFEEHFRPGYEAQKAAQANTNTGPSGAAA